MGATPANTTGQMFIRAGIARGGEGERGWTSRDTIHRLDPLETTHRSKRSKPGRTRPRTCPNLMSNKTSLLPATWCLSPPLPSPQSHHRSSHSALPISAPLISHSQPPPHLTLDLPRRLCAPWSHCGLWSSPGSHSHTHALLHVLSFFC